MSISISITFFRRDICISRRTSCKEPFGRKSSICFAKPKPRAFRPRLTPTMIPKASGAKICWTSCHISIFFFPKGREEKRTSATTDLPRAIGKLAQACQFVVVKLGSQGAIARKGSEEWRRQGMRVASVDSVGAGDSFDAGFIHRFLQGASPAECLEYADIAGAFSNTREGGTEAFRDRDSVEQFFHDHLDQR